jgi:hypothetical protein
MFRVLKRRAYEAVVKASDGSRFFPGRDHLVGWVLAICEVIYFFHPVFYFVKRRILFEREIACDDWVIATCPCRKFRPCLFTRLYVQVPDYDKPSQMWAFQGFIAGERFEHTTYQIFVSGSAWPTIDKS